MDYMDTDVRRPQKAIKLIHSLTHYQDLQISCHYSGFQPIRLSNS